MKIADKPAAKRRTSFSCRALSMVVAGAIVLAACGAVYAADPGPAAVPPPLLPPPALTLQTAAAIDPTKQGGSDMEKSVTAMEDKTADNAKATMKKLDNANDPVMLEDLNSARQTVARIEAMIDIEKHLVELDKLRKEHSTGGPSLANAIPASALTVAPPRNTEMIPQRRMSTESEIVRIQGSDGKYDAVLKLSDGGTKTVRVGDHVSNGVVRSITSSAVEIDDNGTLHTLHIKNADVIFNAMR